MKFSASGSGRVFYKGASHAVSWSKNPHCSYSTIVRFSDGSTIDIEDYDDRFDYSYRPSDDGTIYYNTVVLLDPNEPDPVGIPSTGDLKAKLSSGLQPLTEAVTDQKISYEDLYFCAITKSTGL